MDKFYDESFQSLFSQLMTNQEIAYTILDLLFLYGDPINSTTFFDLIEEENAIKNPYTNQQLSCQIGCPYTEELDNKV